MNLDVKGKRVALIGGAAMFACTGALLNVTYQGNDRGIAFGVCGAVNGAAAGGGRARRGRSAGACVVLLLQRPRDGT